MDINFEYYKIFYYVAKYKNITKAAAVLGSSQPNVTRIIKLLEAQLHCRLLSREPRGISLTEKGEALYSHVESACLRLIQAPDRIGQQDTEDVGMIEIGATETALHLFLLDAMREFKGNHPGIRLKVHNHSTPELLRTLLAGRLDFAALTTPFETPDAFYGEDVWSFREIPVGGPHYRYLSEQKIRRDTLAKLPWIGLGKGTATYDFYKNFFISQGMEVELDMEVATSDLMLPLILNNLGIGFVPEALAMPHLANKELVRIPTDFEAPLRAVRLVSERGRSGSAAANIFYQYLKRRRPES